MLACPVCQMVLGSPGTCPLCGSEVQDAEDTARDSDIQSQNEADSVDLPFGLGEEAASPPPPSLPFGIEEAPDTAPEASEAPSEEDAATMIPSLPFGIEDAPETPPDEALTTDESPTTIDLPFGIEASPSESPPETENLSSNESRIPPTELPFGIDHMHHTPIE